MAEVTSAKAVTTSNGWKTAPGDEKYTREFLDALGLPYVLERRKSYIRACVAQSQSLLDAYRRCGQDRLVTGLLFGFPATAVLSFADKQSLGLEEQEAEMAAAGLGTFQPFRLSRRWHAVEMEVVIRWYKVLREYDLV